jgi:hypothetical protein|tara:strand:- start:47153 stop:47929 length:777 start_codon:yes stop_codon:yes gene_type:complete
MQVTKNYKRGGFFGNSQAKYSDMEGAGRGINMAFANRGLFNTKGSALRQEKRYLKKLEREGRLNEYGPQSADRLDYLRNVQKDRAKKGIAAGALAAGLAFGGPAALSAIKGGALKGGALKAAGKGGLKGLLGKAQKARKVQQALGEAGFFKGMGETPGSDAYGAPNLSIDDMELGAIDEFDAAPDDNFDYDAEATGPNLAANLAQYGNLPFKYGGKMKLLKKGGLVGGQKKLDKNNDGKITAEDFKMLRAMLGARLPR